MIGHIATTQICAAPSIKNTRYALGLFFIFLQCLIWITASVLTQYMFQKTVVDSPFLMTYIGIAECILFFPLFYLHQWWTGDKSTEPNDDESASGEGGGNYTEMIDSISLQVSLNNARSKKPWNHKKHALAALHLAPSMVIADYTFNKGLKHTTVAANTVLVSTASIFVLFFSVLLRIEQFHCAKLIGVLFAIVGTLMTTLEHMDDDENDSINGFSETDLLYGDMFSLIAAVGYAVYTVQARLLCPQREELYSMTLLMAYIGLIAAVPLAPMALFKVAEIWNEMTLGSWAILLVKGLCDFAITDYLLLRSVILTSATIANVGLGLTIPLAFLADAIVQHDTFSSVQICGAIAILIGFVAVNLTSDTEESEAEVPETVGTEHNPFGRELGIIDDTVPPPIV